MRPHLLHPDRDFAGGGPPHASDLVQDLGLDTLFDSMAAGDAFLREVAAETVLSSLVDVDAIRYRQDVLRDFLAHPDLLRALYQLAVEAIEGERRAYFGLFLRSPESVVHRSREVLGWFADCLGRLRDIARDSTASVKSEGLTRLFSELLREIDEDYLERVRRQLADLAFRDGVFASARVGPSMRGTDFVLRRPREDQRGLLAGLAGRRSPRFTIRIADRDEAGHRALRELRERALGGAADALGSSVDHILGFFRELRRELAFYLGCLHLRERLSQLGVPTAFPEPRPAGVREWSFRGLRDPCLALASERPVVGNDLDAPGVRAVLVTGPNQGGKSTFLRSLGLGQLMMQCGMFVAADAFRADVVTGVFTHFRRQEDAGPRAGQLDDECRRMSDIAAALSRDALVLFNESFQATNEREGSEIARQVVEALADAGVKLAFVTHLYEFAHRLRDGEFDGIAFLRAERLPDGARTFRVVPGEPLPTSFGADVYAKVFRRPLDPRPTSSKW